MWADFTLTLPAPLRGLPAPGGQPEGWSLLYRLPVPEDRNSELGFANYQEHKSEEGSSQGTEKLCVLVSKSITKMARINNNHVTQQFHFPASTQENEKQGLNQALVHPLVTAARGGSNPSAHRQVSG